MVDNSKTDHWLILPNSPALLLYVVNNYELNLNMSITIFKIAQKQNSHL